MALKVLSSSDVEQFIELGYVKLAEAFAPAAAMDVQAFLWRKLEERGIRQADRATWTKPIVHIKEAYNGPEFRACETARLTDAWQRALITHPLAYLRHRATFMWQFLGHSNLVLPVWDWLDPGSAYGHSRYFRPLVALHDLNLAAHYADRMALMVAGKIKAIGKPKEVLQPDVIQEAYCLPVQVIQHPFLDIPLVLPGSGKTPGMSY